ncbi:MAG: ABC transporter transmembrane domain-containing protein [Bacteroidales bacterium]
MKENNKRAFSRDRLRDTLRLYSYLKPYAWEYAAGLFFLLGSSLASLAFPKLLGDLVNAGNESSLGENLGHITMLLVILLLVQSTFSYFRTILFVNVTEKTLADLRQRTYNHMIMLPVTFMKAPCRRTQQPHLFRYFPAPGDTHYHSR